MGPLCSPPLLTVGSGAPSRALLSSSYGTWHLLSPGLSFWGPQDPAHTLPGSPLALPVNLKRQAQAFQQVGASSPPPAAAGSRGHCVLPPSAKNQSDAFPKINSRTGTFHIFSVNSLSSEQLVSVLGRDYKSAATSPCLAERESGARNAESKSPSAGGVPKQAFLAAAHERANFAAGNFGSGVSIYLSRGGRERPAVRWSQAPAH